MGDALRAKRAFEAAERAARNKEQQEKERQQAINEELSVARKRQTAEKERRLAEQALKDRQAFLEEGNQVRRGIAAERAKLEGIKAKKIEELKKVGVPQKYWSELARKKISV